MLLTSLAFLLLLVRLKVFNVYYLSLLSEQIIASGSFILSF